MAGLGNRTFQGFGLHPIVSQRLDNIFTSIDRNKAAIEAAAAKAVSPAQSKSIANSAVTAALATLNQSNGAFNYGEPAQLFLDGPISTAGGFFVITKPAPLAATLNSPSVANGHVLRVFSVTPFAHVISTVGFALPGLLLTGTPATQTANFSSHPGAGVVLVAYNNVWIVESSQGVTFS